VSEAPDQDDVRVLLRKAARTLDDAEYLLADDRTEAAINRSYYAALYAARAALLTEGEEPSSHAGVLSRFSYHFIHSGRIAERIGKTLARAETLRNRADYDVYSELDPGTAEDLVENVFLFVETVQEVLEET